VPPLLLLRLLLQALLLLLSLGLVLLLPLLPLCHPSHSPPPFTPKALTLLVGCKRLVG
jgi:hypothetical protein